MGPVAIAILPVAAERIKHGARSPAEVDVIEARPLSGQVRATIRYFTDTECAAASSHIIELTIAGGGA